MATQTLTQRHADASVAAPVPIDVLAGGSPSILVILALDLGPAHRPGAPRWRDRQRHLEFRPAGFEGE